MSRGGGGEKEGGRKVEQKVGEKGKMKEERKVQEKEEKEEGE